DRSIDPRPPAFCIVQRLEELIESRGEAVVQRADQIVGSWETAIERGGAHTGAADEFVQRRIERPLGEIDLGCCEYLLSALGDFASFGALSFVIQRDSRPLSEVYYPHNAGLAVTTKVDHETDARTE